MNVERLFKDDPPKQPLTTLSAIVEDWQHRFGPNGKHHYRRDHIGEWCAQAVDLQTAIWRACRSRDPQGKMHNHQSRVPEAKRERLAVELISHSAFLMVCRNFDWLYDEVEITAPLGIGPVTIYDVAQRLNAFLRLPEASLYLHAGVRQGYKLLMGRRAPDVKRIPKIQLPQELQALPVDEVEDLLCTYRDFLHPAMVS